MKTITGLYRTKKYGTWEPFEITVEKKPEDVKEFCKKNIVTPDGRKVREVMDVKIS